MNTLIATSRILKQKLDRDLMTDCHRIPNGFSSRNFQPFASPPEKPEDMQFGQEKTFVYWGHLSAPWMDWDLLGEVARRHPKWVFNMIGHSLPHQRVEAPNIFYLGQKRVEALAPYGYYADIGFVHFKDDALIQAVNPVKVYEYLACNLPVISTPMPELEDFPMTFQVRDADAFEAAVEEIESKALDWSQCNAFLKQSSWQARAKALLDLSSNVRK